uniref:Uncharacterized protein n=1 Tax=Arundo donax TaxID=35708 RepID=A0A0A9B1D7_ARUDO
MLSVLCGGGCG